MLISAFVFATRIVQSLYFLYTKFPASSYPLWLHSTVCVGPGRKPRRPVFSQRGSFYFKAKDYSHVFVLIASVPGHCLILLITIKYLFQAFVLTCAFIYPISTNLTTVRFLSVLDSLFVQADVNVCFSQVCTLLLSAK